MLPKGLRVCCLGRRGVVQSRLNSWSIFQPLITLCLALFDAADFIPPFLTPAATDVFRGWPSVLKVLPAVFMRIVHNCREDRAPARVQGNQIALLTGRCAIGSLSDRFSINATHPLSVWIICAVSGAGGATFALGPSVWGCLDRMGKGAPCCDRRRVSISCHSVVELLLDGVTKGRCSCALTPPLVSIGCKLRLTIVAVVGEVVNPSLVQQPATQSRPRVGYRQQSHGCWDVVLFALEEATHACRDMPTQYHHKQEASRSTLTVHMQQ